MLTLFPRIRPNPIPPPPVPLAPPEPKAAEPAPKIAPISIEVPTQGVSTVETENDLSSANGAPTTEEVPAEDAATSVSDSDVFSAFLSGMATSNSDPFIVEINAQPAVAEPKDDSEPSGAAPQALPECAPEIVEPMPAAVAPSARAEQALASEAALVDDPVAPTQNPEPASEAISTRQSAENVTPELIVAGANIFDELDVLHEAAITSSLQCDTPTSPDCARALGPAAESQNKTGAEARGEDFPEIKTAEAARVAALVPTAEPAIPGAIQGVANERLAAISDEGLTAEHLTQELASAPGPVESATKPPGSESNSSETAEPQTAAQDLSAITTKAKADTAAVEGPPAKDRVSEEGDVSATPSSSSEPREQVLTKPSAHSSPRLPKPSRAKGTFFGLARVPEPETMDDSCEVDAYASAAAQAHLDAIDDTFVAHAQLLLKGRERGRVLDIGTGPGQIVIKLGYRLTRWKFVGIDRSAVMIEKAIESLATAGELAGRVEFRVADGNALNFPDKSFEMVVCNSVLHHIPDPQKLFGEIVRVVKPGGAILLRDLRRPSRPGYAFHVWKHGKHYSGEMRRLFIASVQAAYTEEELQKMIAASPLRDVRVFRHGKTHIGFERPLAIPTATKK